MFEHLKGLCLILPTSSEGQIQSCGSFTQFNQPTNWHEKLHSAARLVELCNRPNSSTDVCVRTLCRSPHVCGPRCVVLLQTFTDSAVCDWRSSTLRPHSNCCVTRPKRSSSQTTIFPHQECCVLPVAWCTCSNVKHKPSNVDKALVSV